MASVVSEYLKIFYEYSELYGDDTVVLMQVGSFYEMYGIDNDEEKVGNVQEVSRLLNVVLTKRNKPSLVYIIFIISNVTKSGHFLADD